MCLLRMECESKPAYELERDRIVARNRQRLIELRLFEARDAFNASIGLGRRPSPRRRIRAPKGSQKAQDRSHLKRAVNTGHVSYQELPSPVVSRRVKAARSLRGLFFKKAW